MRDEHEEKLKKAFADAKASGQLHPFTTLSNICLFNIQVEAGETHSKELAVLREQSKATLEQVKTAHRSEIDSITASHEETLSSQVKSMEKQISTLKLELSATQDDLAKAKGALSSAKSEVDGLKAQVDQAAMEAEMARTASGSEKEAAVADLAKRLSNTQQEMNDLTVSGAGFLVPVSLAILMEKNAFTGSFQDESRWIRRRDGPGQAEPSAGA